MKPENIMLDHNFDVKLVDFGFSAPLLGRDHSGLLRTCLGTTAYMAPELVMKQAYSGEKVDIFAMGVILFIMVAGHPPFRTA